MNNRLKALEVLSKVSGRSVEEIRPEMELVADLNIDSPKVLELLVELEDALGIEISDEDAIGMDKVSDVLGYVEAL